MKQSSNLKNIEFKCCSFEDYTDLKNCVIYCDPPYKNTTKYKQQYFSYDVFYDWCRHMSKDNTVIISEYQMPEDFECIWSKPTKVTIDSNKVANSKKDNRVEKLFMYKG